MHRSVVLLGQKVRFKDAYLPYFRRLQESAKRERYRQTPFLDLSKEPSMRPPLPDPRRKELIKVDLAREMNVMVGDRVQVLFGSEKGKQGIINRIMTRKNQVLVSGVNMKRSFWHPEPGPGKPSIMSVECPIHITNVIPLDPVTKQPTRLKRRYSMTGECVRISKVSGSAMPAPVPVRPSEREILYAKHQEKALIEEKPRRGAAKEDFFGNREHFKTLVRIMRTQQSSEAARGPGQRTPAALDEW